MLQSTFSKYLYVITIGFQNTFVYRWNFLLRVLFSLVPLIGTFYLWKAVFGSSKAEIAGYAFGNMVSYFLALLVLDSLTTPTEDDFQIAAEIRDGLINQFLLKPVNYLAYRFSLFWSYRMIYTSTTILPIFVILWIMKDYLILPTSPLTWFLIALSTLLSATLQFLLSYCLALLAFWILDVSASIFIVFSIEYLAGGHVFPLDLLPSWLYWLLMATPFPYEYWLPLGIFMKRFETNALIFGLGMQIFWCLAFWKLAKWIWSRGIRHYTAVGG